MKRFSTKNSAILKNRQKEGLEMIPHGNTPMPLAWGAL